MTRWTVSAYFRASPRHAVHGGEMVPVGETAHARHLRLREPDDGVAAVMRARKGDQPDLVPVEVKGYGVPEGDPRDGVVGEFLPEKRPVPQPGPDVLLSDDEGALPGQEVSPRVLDVGMGVDEDPGAALPQGPEGLQQGPAGAPLPGVHEQDPVLPDRGDDLHRVSAPVGPELVEPFGQPGDLENGLARGQGARCEERTSERRQDFLQEPHARPSSRLSLRPRTGPRSRCWSRRSAPRTGCSWSAPSPRIPPGQGENYIRDVPRAPSAPGRGPSNLTVAEDTL